MQNTRLKLAISCVLLLMGAATPATATEEYGPNLIVTGAFTDGDGAKATDWGTGLYNDAQGEVRRVKAEKLPSTEWALQLRHAPPFKGLVQSSCQPCPVPDDRQAHKLRFSCQYKGQGSVQLRFCRRQGEKTAWLTSGAGTNVWLTRQLPATDDWTNAEQTWDLPPEVFQAQTSFTPTIQLWAPARELTVSNMTAQLTVEKQTGDDQTAAEPPTPPTGGKIIFSPPASLPLDEEAWWAGHEAPYPLSIRDGLFLKKGKPAYLLGTLGAEWGINSLWLRRVLGYDYSSIGWGDNISAGPRKMDDGEKRLVISFTEPLPLYSYCSETIRNNQLPELICGGSHPYGPLRRYMEEYPDINEFFSCANHSFCYDFHSPVGRDIYRWGFENKLKYLNRLPLLAYEIYREPGYRPVRERVQKGFIAFVRGKYGDLALANKAWRTAFETWEQIQPPHLKNAALAFSWSDRLANIANVYEKQPEMYNDWLEYLRYDFYTGTLAVKSMFKQLSDKPFTYDCRTQRTYFDGYAAIDPELVADVVDIFFCHTGYGFFEYSNQPADEKSVLTSLMDSTLYHDFLSDNVDKPILNTENIVSKVRASGSSTQAMADNCFGKFHGEAPFTLVESEEAIKPEWLQADFDDSSWTCIPVPGPWDETEEYKGRTGWGCYRFHFKMPGGLARQSFLDGSCRYLIYGKGVAQKGTFWLNGQKIGEPKGWSTKYEYDVSGLLNYGGDNTLVLVVDGSTYYAEGIRFYLYLLADNMLNEARPVSKKHYESMFWSNLVHGCSGNTYWHWDKYVHWYMPELKAAVESAAPIVLPKAGTTGKIAMLYPYESFRGMLNAPAEVYLDYMNYFGAATFSHVPTDILSCRKLMAIQSGRYPMLILPYAHLVRRSCFERVEQFVSEGGTAVITYDSLIQDDWLYEKLPIEALAGVKVTGDVSEENPSLSFRGKTYKLQVGDMTGKAGVRIETAGAEVIGTYADASPAITVNKHGKGRVCYVAARLDMSAAQALLESLMDDAGIRAPLAISTTNEQEEPFVEARVIGDPERFVLYLLNWGGQTHDLNVSLDEQVLADSGYRVRDIIAAAGGDGKTVRYSHRKLKRGLSLSVKPQEPVALLFETVDAEPLALTSVSPARKQMISELEELFANSAEPTGKPKVLFLTDLCDTHKAYGPELYPIVCQLLRRAGFELQTLPFKTITPGKLREFDLVFLGEECSIPYSSLRKSDFPDWLATYLNEGGNLMLLFSSNGIMHNSGSSGLMKKIIEPAFKVSQIWRGWCENPNACGYGDPLQIRTDTITRHPVTEYVENVQFFVASAMSTGNEAFTPLVSSRADDLRQPSKPLVMAGEVGNGGRILLAGDTLWTQPERVEEADNLQLLVNAIHWLAKKPITKIDKAALTDQLIVSRAKLNRMEETE